MMICESSNEHVRSDGKLCSELQTGGMMVICMQIEGDVTAEYRTRGIGVSEIARRGPHTRWRSDEMAPCRDDRSSTYWWHGTAT